jgi:uncharacterized protein YcfL
MYITIESQNLITPQATLLKVAQRLPNKTQDKTNIRAPVYWYLKNCSNLITTERADPNILKYYL